MPRKKTRIILATAITGALAASVVVVANAGADEVAVPGRVEAESFAAQSGAQVEGTSDTGGGKNVGWLTDGDWLRFDQVTVGSTVTARIASQNTSGGSIELRSGSLTGALLSTIPVASTGGWQKWVSTTADSSTFSGSVFAVLRSKSPSDFVNINWFSFVASAPPSSAPPSSAPPATGDGWVPIDNA
jgi:hypothetical protein